MTNVLITGAAGNLGGLISRYIRDNEDELSLILMEHHKKISDDVRGHQKVQVRYGDLSVIGTLGACLEGADTIVHFAGVLFKANPEKFLYQTNVWYFENLVRAAREKNIEKIILISFPHVEGPTSRQSPATGRLDRNPVSVHAKTRLMEEKHLFKEVEKGISLRVGMVYGKGILMVDAASWLAERCLLGVWRKPTEIHLISKTDFCRTVVAAIKNDRAKGVYHVGDEGDDTLQSFLDYACTVWRCKRPWRLPLWLIYLAAGLSERFSRVFGTASPLTKDFIDIGRVPYHGDTSRLRKELLPTLQYPTIKEGIKDLQV